MVFCSPVAVHRHRWRKMTRSSAPPQRKKRRQCAAWKSTKALIRHRRLAKPMPALSRCFCLWVMHARPFALWPESEWSRVHHPKAKAARQCGHWLGEAAVPDKRFCRFPCGALAALFALWRRAAAGHRAPAVPVHRHRWRTMTRSSAPPQRKKRRQCAAWKSTKALIRHRRLAKPMPALSRCFCLWVMHARPFALWPESEWSRVHHPKAKAARQCGHWLGEAAVPDKRFCRFPCGALAALFALWRRAAASHFAPAVPVHRHRRAKNHTSPPPCRRQPYCAARAQSEALYFLSSCALFPV